MTQERDSLGRFIKGHVGYVSSLGKSPSQEARDKMSAAKIGMYAYDKNYFWNGGIKYKKGRKMIMTPGHPNVCPQGYVLEHRLIAEKALGRYLEKHEIVHHINKDVLDNRNENLLICEQGYHNTLHNKMRAREREDVPVMVNEVPTEVSFNGEFTYAGRTWR